MESNTIRNILLGILVIILGCAVYFLFVAHPGERTPPKTATSTSEQVDLNSSISVQSVSINDNNEKKNYEINAQYPQITGLKDAVVQKKINDDIDARMNVEMENFKLSEADTTVEVGMPVGKSTLDVNFARITPAPYTNILSFSIAKEYYSLGAAHPGHTYLAFNYDLKTGKRVALKDLFVGEYVKVFSQKSIKELTEKLGDDANDETIKDGAGPKEENFKLFFPTSVGLKLLFNEYQVASYVNGPQEVVIPYSQLKDVINREGQLKDL